MVDLGFLDWKIGRSEDSWEDNWKIVVSISDIIIYNYEVLILRLIGIIGNTAVQEL